MAVALEDPVGLTGRHLKVIARVSNNTLRSTSTEDYEPDYVEIDGLLQVGQAIEAAELDSEASLKTSTQHRQLQKFYSGVPLKMSIGTPGLLDALYFREDSDYRLPFAGNEVEAQVKAIGLNFMDCLVALAANVLVLLAALDRIAVSKLVIMSACAIWALTRLTCVPL